MVTNLVTLPPEFWSNYLRSCTEQLLISTEYKDGPICEARADAVGLALRVAPLGLPDVHGQSRHFRAPPPVPGSEI